MHEATFFIFFWESERPLTFELICSLDSAILSLIEDININKYLKCNVGPLQVQHFVL